MELHLLHLLLYGPYSDRVHLTDCCLAVDVDVDKSVFNSQYSFLREPVKSKKGTIEIRDGRRKL
jgi:hypothetical protein